MRLDTRIIIFLISLTEDFLSFWTENNIRLVLCWKVRELEPVQLENARVVNFIANLLILFIIEEIRVDFCKNSYELS